MNRVLAVHRLEERVPDFESRNIEAEGARRRYKVSYDLRGVTRIATVVCCDSTAVATDNDDYDDGRHTCVPGT